MKCQPIRLIVNADDFGYFPCVSRGIVDAAKRGAITATGILATSPDLDWQLEWLKKHEQLDLGVHLNLTSGKALSREMQERLPGLNGLFPGVYTMASWVLKGKLGVEVVRGEWRAQIERCLQWGLRLRFLNSHEHIHMLPGLFRLVIQLADEYCIPQVRMTRAEWLPPFAPRSLVRNTLIQTLGLINRRWVKFTGPRLLGLAYSGRLSIDILQRSLARLKPGGWYELMCHPGHFDPGEIMEPKLLAYHNWAGEYSLLTGSEVRSLYEKYNIQLAGYRDLPTD